MSSGSTSHNAWAIFLNRDFSFLMASRFFSVLSLVMVTVAVGWQVYDATRKPLDLGLVGLAQFLPVLLLMPVTGSVADRVDRRKILIICYVLGTGVSLAPLFLIPGSLTEAWPIVVTLAVLATIRAFSMPATQSLLPNLVSRTELGSAVAWASSINKFSMISGPAIGGLLIVFGPATVYFASAASLAMAAVFMTLIRKGQSVPDAATPVLSLESVMAGIVFIRSRTNILGAISLDLFAVLLGGVTAMLPIFARDVLVVGPLGLGLLRSAPAIGAAIVAFCLAHRPLGDNAGRMMLMSVAVYGLATALFGLSQNFIWSTALLMVLGGADMCGQSVRQTMVQLGTPDSMRGRVSAITSLSVNTANQLGQVESGLAAAAFGVIPSVVLGGIGSVLVAALWARQFSGLSRIDLSPQGIEDLVADAE